MSTTSRVFPYRTLPIPQYASLDQILAALHEDSLFTSWDAELPELRSVEIPEAPRSCHFDDIRARSSLCFQSAQTAYKAFDDYKATLEGIAIPGHSRLAELARCNMMQEMVRQLVERHADLHCLAYEILLRGQPVPPEVCDAVSTAATWVQKLWDDVVRSHATFKPLQSRKGSDKAESGSTSQPDAEGAGDDASSLCSFKTARSATGSLTASQLTDVLPAVAQPHGAPVGQNSSAWKRTVSVFRTLSQRMSQR